MGQKLTRQGAIQAQTVARYISGTWRMTPSANPIYNLIADEPKNAPPEVAALVELVRGAGGGHH
jgi:hypothetical protein